jgi:8-oxo-dGTP pyrophosphatase MutT (NUDIX family)
MSTSLGRLGVVEFATAGVDLDTGRVVAARIAVLDDDGDELARWDWGSDAGERVVGEVAQTLRTLQAVGIPLAVYDAAAGLTVLDRECRRRGIPPLENPAPVLDPLLLDHLLAPEYEGSRSLSALAARYDVPLGSLVAGRLVRAMAAHDGFAGTPHALHARQRGMIDDWPVVPLEDVRLIEDTQPIPAPPPRPSDTVPMFDFSDTGVLALEAAVELPAEEAQPDEPVFESDLPADETAVAAHEEPDATVEPESAPEPESESDPDGEQDPAPPPAMQPETMAVAPERAPRRIHVAAAIVTDPAGRAVVVRKRGTTGFMQPGGKIERGESALSALVRELDEELGLTVDVDATEFLGSFEADALNEPGARVRAEVFALTTSAELHPRGEIDAVHWLDSPDDVDSVQLAPLTTDVLLPLWAARRPTALF